MFSDENAEIHHFDQFQGGAQLKIGLQNPLSIDIPGHSSDQTDAAERDPAPAHEETIMGVVNVSPVNTLALASLLVQLGRSAEESMISFETIHT